MFQFINKLILLLLLTTFVPHTEAGLPFFKKKSRQKKEQPFIRKPKLSFEHCIHIQTHLDRFGFSPGKIDGDLGAYTEKAVYWYNKSRNIRPGNWDPILRDASRLKSTFQAYKIQKRDLTYVNPDLPYKPEFQAEAPYMSYRSLVEFVAERFHTTEGVIQRLNPKLDVRKLAPNDIVMAPNVVPFRIESIPTDKWYDKDTTLSNRTLVVDTKERMAVLYQTDLNSPIIGAYPITPGKEKYISYGTWKVKIMITTPTFRYDKKMLEEGERSDEYFMIPRGPNSPVGMFWAGLTKSGIGLHGTRTPHTIGRSESAGCIRLANWDAVRLPLVIRKGATVIIQ